MDSRQWGVRVIVLAAFTAGWKVNGWHRDSAALVAQKAAQQVAESVTQREIRIDKEVAKVLEDKLSALKANEVHTEREILREVVKPVFSAVCASDDYVRLFNAAAARKEIILSGVSGESTDAVPSAVAPTGR